MLLLAPSCMSGIIDHSTANIGARNSSHQFAIVDNRQATNLFLYHNHGSLSNVISRLQGDRIVNHQRINGTIHEVVPFLNKKEKGVLERSPRTQHFIEAGKDGADRSEE